MAAPDGHLRVSDAERDRIVEILRRHASDGRLTLDEFEDRVGEALAATTRDELGTVLRDLPPPPPDQPDPPRRARPVRRVPWPSDVGRAVLPIVAVVVTVVLVASSGWALWWLVFPLMGVFGGCGRGGRSCATGRWREAEDGRHADRDAEDDREVIRV